MNNADLISFGWSAATYVIFFLVGGYIVDLIKSEHAHPAQFDALHILVQLPESNWTEENVKNVLLSKGMGRIGDRWCRYLFHGLVAGIPTGAALMMKYFSDKVRLLSAQMSNNLFMLIIAPVLSIIAERFVLVTYRKVHDSSGESHQEGWQIFYRILRVLAINVALFPVMMAIFTVLTNLFCANHEENSVNPVCSAGVSMIAAGIKWLGLRKLNQAFVAHREKNTTVRLLITAFYFVLAGGTWTMWIFFTYPTESAAMESDDTAWTIPKWVVIMACVVILVACVLFLVKIRGTYLSIVGETIEADVTGVLHQLNQIKVGVNNAKTSHTLMAVLERYGIDDIEDVNTSLKSTYKNLVTSEGFQQMIVIGNTLRQRQPVV